jgi:hypothetical protein
MSLSSDAGPEARDGATRDDAVPEIRVAPSVAMLVVTAGVVLGAYFAQTVAVVRIRAAAPPAPTPPAPAPLFPPSPFLPLPLPRSHTLFQVHVWSGLRAVLALVPAQAAVRTGDMRGRSCFAGRVSLENPCP